MQGNKNNILLNNDLRKLFLQNDLPMRWTAPEALLPPHVYSEKSDV